MCIRDRDGRGLHALHERPPRTLARVAPLQVDHRRGDVLPRAVDDGQLATGAKPGIDAEDRLRAERRREEDLADVLGEDVNRRLVGDVLERLVDLRVDREEDVRLQREARRLLQERLGRRRGPGARGPLELGEQPFLCLLYTSPSPRDRTRYRMPSSA